MAQLLTRDERLHQFVTREPCDGCGKPVPIGGGIANIWTTEGQQTGGLTLELADGSEHFLCFDCIERLPDDPTAADVAGLSADETRIGDEDPTE